MTPLWQIHDPFMTVYHPLMTHSAPFITVAERRFLFRSSSNLSSILYILTGKEGNVGRPDFIHQIFIFTSKSWKFLCIWKFAPTVLKFQPSICRGLFKIGCANHLWVPKKWECKTCNLHNWDSKSWCIKGAPPLACMVFVSGATKLGALGVLLSTQCFTNK